MSSETFTDTSMLEIFCVEVETHVESLTAGLLALERDPRDKRYLAEMMRGAHSIKGAARIVGIDPAARVAHVMEDGFVAAQSGQLIFRSEQIDVLLRAVDLLNRIANGSKHPAIDWNQFDAEATLLVAEITSVLAGGPVALSEAMLAPAEPLNVFPAPSAATSRELTIPLPEFFNAVAAESARLAFVAGLDSEATLIRFDLSQTRDIDATGLALLVAVFQHRNPHVAKSRPNVELFGAGTDLRTVLQSTGIDRLDAVGDHG
ncbi:MAG: Hpt domain-containing protein [Planctomycetales bacterium]|jgi:two-component system sensor histidine kinase and response regulator WspE|nr:Hpt domain-containing protein [Planctomycetales bacterium]